MPSPHTIAPTGAASYAVFRDGIRVSPFYSNVDAASAKANKLDRITLVTLRACLCCTKNFKSTGRHHRLCDTCRQAA